jgi:hypothetical protein
MKKKVKIISSVIVCCLFLFMAYGSGDDKKVDIQSEQEIREFLPGKWRGSMSYSGMNVFYRLLITENQIKIWKKNHFYSLGEPSENWKENPDEIIDYTIGPLDKESHGNKYRLLGKCELGNIMISSGKGDEGWLEVGNIEFNWNDSSLSLDKGWED